MTEINQIITQIRFELDQLTRKNAHHDFEHLCRHLTRARICTNILPATGPVSAGGDQGRDFETFQTYISSSPIANSTFIGKISNKPIAFACTIQKEMISNKIKDDINIIMKSGSPVISIHYFCITDVNISLRHKLQAWVKEKYDINLEIHDGQSISELLSDQETFWIAVEYLEIPSEIYPKNKDSEIWYVKLLKKWNERESPNDNYADFYEIKSATRHATFSSNLKQDLPFWIKLLEKFINNDFQLDLKRKAIYEIAVVSLKGLGTLNGQEIRLQDYFSKIPILENPNDLEDASTLLSYTITSHLQNNVQLTKGELLKWRKLLFEKVENILEITKNPNHKCFLLEIRGFLSLSIDPEKPQMPKLKEATKWWNQMIKIIKNAPLFPLERFADRLTVIIGLFPDAKNINKLTKQIDKLLSNRYGSFIAAEKCRNRAIKFYENEKILEAINELHQAKINWFAEETIYGSLLSMLFLSKLYLELGLSFAAKYYSLAVAYIVLNSPNSDIKPLSSRALIAAAECDYHQGCWCGFLDLTEIGLITYGMFYKNTDNSPANDDFERTLFHLVTLFTITKQFDTQLDEFVINRIQEWKIDDYTDDLLSMSEETWGKMDISELWKRLEDQLIGRPFNDVGIIREISWSEFGIIWNIEWKNDYITTSKAEQFIAILQIFLTDLTNIDLCLLKTKININLYVENLNEPKIESIPSNDGRKWNIILPTHHQGDDKTEIERLQKSVIALASHILAEISLLPIERFMKVIENRFKNGIAIKVFVAKPFETLYREFIPENIYDSSERALKFTPELYRPFNIKEHKDLGWLNKPGPSYSKKSAKEFLKNRYNRLRNPIKYTLKRLLKSSELKTIIKKLHDDGWLDWHILTAIATATINYRVNQNPEAREDIELSKKLFTKFMDEPEKKTDTIIPLSEFTDEKLRFYQQITIISTLKNLNFECRQRTPDIKAIDHFLRNRYNYWTDDIEHDDPFH